MKRLLIKILSILMVVSITMFIVGCTSCGSCTHECDVDWIIDKQATCTEDGLKNGECKICGKFLSENIQRLGHDCNVFTKNASCTNNGYSIYECSRCDYVNVCDFKSGHTYGDWTKKKIPTCTEDGLEEQTCSICGEFNRNTLKAFGHTYTPIVSETIGSLTYITYECDMCKGTKTITEGENIYEEQRQDLLFDVEPSFSFIVKTSEDEAYIRKNLKIIDAYFNNTKYEDYEGINIEYTLKKQDSIAAYSSDKVEYTWVVTPTEDYEHDTTYIAKIDGDIEFSACSAQTMTFTIASDENHVNTVIYRDDIVFLKALEINSSGYYPYSLEHIIPSSEDSMEGSPVLCLTVGKVDGLEVGQILCIGDVVSTEEITDEIDCDFGKVDNFYKLSSGQWMIILSEPELEEIFEELDISYEEEVDFESSDINEEQVKVELVNSLYQSESFVKFLASANVAAKEYASERNLDISYIATADNFMKNISISPAIRFSGNKLYGSLTGELKIPLNNSNKVEIGNIKVSFVFDVESSFNIDVGYQLKKTKLFDIVYGIKYFDISLTESDTIGFSFDISVDVDYSLEEGKYIQNTESGKIHLKGCIHVDSVKDTSKLKSINAKDAEKQIKEKASRECKHCLPMQGFNYDLLVINKSQGVIHTYNCMYVAQMSEQNKEISPKNPELIKKYTCCDWCHPDEREKESYNKYLKDSLNYSDWKQVAVDISSWAKDAGYKTSVVNNRKIAGVDMHICGPIRASVDIYFILEFDLEASLSYDYKYKQTNRYGMRIEGGRPTPYSSEYSQTVKDDLMLMGKCHVEVGMLVDANVNIAGLTKWIRAGVTAEVDLYADASGIVYINNNSNSTDQNYAAGYFEVGVEFDVDAYYKLFSWENSVDVYTFKHPFLQKGYDRVYYGYASPVDTLEVDGSFDIENLLEVKYLDLKTLAQKQDKLIINGVNGLYNVHVSLEKGEFFSIINGKIIESKYAPAYFEDVLTITITRQENWENYIVGSSVFYIKDYVINLVGSGNGEFYTEGLEFALINNDTEYSVTRYTGTSTEVYIHTTYNGKPVTSIGSYAFYNCDSLTSVIIGNGVTTIDDDAFYHCTSLTNIVIPDSVTSIGNCAFHSCSLTNIVIPDSVTSIGQNAFAFCASLTSVVIGNNVTSIGDGAFVYCDSLTNITVGIESTTYKSIDGNLYSKDGKILIQYVVGKKDTTFTIPNCVITIGEEAFFCCKSLKNIIIPNSVTSIEEEAFRECGSLTSIVIPDSVTSIGDGAFTNCESLTNIVIGNGVTDLVYCVFSNCRSLTSIVIPNSVENIGNRTFAYCDSLKSVVIGESVSSMDTSSFEGCYSLTSITVDINNKYYKSIDGNLYSKDEKKLIQYAQGKTDVAFIVPNTVTSIGNRAFYDCTSLTSIVIPNTVTNIGYRAFFGCSLLIICCEAENKSDGWLSGWNILDDSWDNTYVPVVWNCNNNGVADDGCVYATIDGIRYSLNDGEARIYKQSKNISIANIPSSVSYKGNTYNVTSIGNYAFSSCSSLTSIVIPDSVTSIGDYAFYGCSSLTSMVIPDSVTSIGSFAFEYCSKLTSITIGDSVTSIGNYAFSSCSSLTSIVIPDSVTSIGSYAFYNCDLLISVTVGNSVTSIGDRAFFRCKSLTSVRFSDISTWYRTTSSIDWNNKTGGVQTSVANSSTNVAYFGSTYFDYCWYKL